MSNGSPHWLPRPSDSSEYRLPAGAGRPFFAA